MNAIDAAVAHSPLPAIQIEATDYERLAALVGAARANSGAAAEALLAELDRAQVVAATDLSAATVRMGSEVTFRDEVAGRVQSVRLVYPGEADIAQRRVSVLTPIGAALIGLSAGQSIVWETPAGQQRRLTVLMVSPPAPESGGAADPAERG
jgi:regulator of nucleoside diphosphate kinase